ncbi:MAG: hypothetical protein ACR2ND_04815 [Solirubrobacteraceae bacterium]
MSELSQLPDGTVGSQHLGVRIFSVCAPTMQELIDRIAVILGEHLDPGDELHVSFNSMQNGSQEHARAKLLQTSRRGRSSSSSTPRYSFCGPWPPKLASRAAPLSGDCLRGDVQAAGARLDPRQVLAGRRPRS